MAGVEPVGLPRVEVKVMEEMRRDKGRREYHRGVVRVEGGELVGWSTGGQRSSRIGSFKGANALFCLEAGEGAVRKGEVVEALLMGKVG